MIEGLLLYNRTRKLKLTHHRQIEEMVGR